MKKVFIFIVLALTICSCGPKFSDIKITDCKIESVSIAGLHGIDAVLSIKVDNPVKALTISDISGTIKVKGNPALNLTAEDVALEGRCEKYYKLPVNCILAEDFSVYSLLSSFKNTEARAFSADISAKVKLKSGLGTILSFKDVPIDSILK